MIISINAQKILNEIQQFFMIKTLNKLGRQGNYLNMIKVMYQKSQIIFSMVRN